MGAEPPQPRWQQASWLSLAIGVLATASAGLALLFGPPLYSEAGARAGYWAWHAGASIAVIAVALVSRRRWAIAAYALGWLTSSYLAAALEPSKLPFATVLETSLESLQLFLAPTCALLAFTFLHGQPLVALGIVRDQRSSRLRVTWHFFAFLCTPLVVAISVAVSIAIAWSAEESRRATWRAAFPQPRPGSKVCKVDGTCFYECDGCWSKSRVDAFSCDVAPPDQPPACECRQGLCALKEPPH
jgi:hypothetical protein